MGIKRSTDDDVKCYIDLLIDDTEICVTWMELHDDTKKGAPYIKLLLCVYLGNTY